jgi:hypothetical protein
MPQSIVYIAMNGVDCFSSERVAFFSDKITIPAVFIGCRQISSMMTSHQSF